MNYIKMIKGFAFYNIALRIILAMHLLASKGEYFFYIPGKCLQLDSVNSVA